jgi:hypothetical protein
MTSEELAEKLKTIAQELGVTRLQATQHESALVWTYVTVRHSSGVFDESPDGWETEIQRRAI